MLRKNIFSLTGALLLGTALLPAAETQSGAFARAQQQLKTQYPTEMAEITRLASTDMDAAMKQMRELALKAKIQLPRTRPQRRRAGGREGGPQPEGDFNGPPPPGDFGGGGPRRRGPMMQMNLLARFQAEYALRKSFPQETDQLDQLLLETEKKFQLLAAKAKVQLPQSVETKLRLLKAAKPAEFAKITEESSGDPRGAMPKLQKLAQSAGIELFSRPPRGPRMEGDEPPPPEAPGMRQINRPNLRLLRKKYPQEMAKYEELRSSDPQAARKLLQELNRRAMEEKK